MTLEIDYIINPWLNTISIENNKEHLNKLLNLGNQISKLANISINPGSSSVCYRINNIFIIHLYYIVLFFITLFYLNISLYQHHCVSLYNDEPIVKFISVFLLLECP